MNKFFSILAAVVVLSPVAVFADSCGTTPAVTHEEYRYQEQIDVDPTPSKSWVYIGQKTAWTTDTEVNGHAIDEEFSVGKFIKVTHRWHQTDQRTVTDQEATDIPCDSGGDATPAKSSSTISGGGGYTYCDLHTGYAVGPQHNCLTRDGKIVQTLAWRGTPTALATNNEELKVKLVQLVGILQQMIQYLKTH